jgi:hypothetical protein
MSPGASDAEILAAEARIGRRLPPSYRAFLQTSASSGAAYLPVGEIDRFRVRESEWLAGFLQAAGAYQDAPSLLPDDPTDPATFAISQLADAVVITQPVDERVSLLNPAVTDADGEWEAWDFANWYPGAYRIGRSPPSTSPRRRMMGASG